jgi:hypothetical protein
MIRTGTQPPRAASYPGLPEERMPIGLVTTMAVEMALVSAAPPAEAAGARCKPPGQIPGLGGAPSGDQQAERSGQPGSSKAREGENGEDQAYPVD